MSYLAKYKKEDFKQVSWEEYGKTLEKLHDKVAGYIKEKDIKIDAVVPILRGAAFPGAYLTFKCGLLRMLPVQYKYLFKNNKIELRCLLSLPKIDLPEKPTFLLVEQNHCFGVTASMAVKDLKEMFPDCKIIYAADHIDYSYQKVEGVEIVFYGKLTNETRDLSKKECEEKGISPFSYLFPWESIEEEWTTVEGKQFNYRDVEKIFKTSEIKKVIENE
ncbi:phosphoribosyltransferase [Candidatus Parcubacteria bacterium]|nr:phosphoribosyltransferase [Candidatus Parcubacteria bacterium]